MTADDGAHTVGTAAHDVRTRDDQRLAVPPRQDRVRWGPVWAGLVVALPTFLLIEVITLALGWWDIAEQDGTEAGVISGVAGLVAFFLGGLTAGASSMWRGVDDGLLHGILVWSAGIVAILGLALLGGGALLGPLSQVVGDIGAVGTPDVDPAQAADAVTSSASWASLGLGLTIIASALGGVVGSKMWPSKRDVAAEHPARR
ncbi:permease [Klenkia taihuensis]|uniref:Uncharacterized protein n=1 Tax=Klenkia taihuensis TaxID=1225127 RepID=A0A1I1USW9_9ACTN|nr:permease [Klenkia taihuensis]GHE13944.1 hypothetical protein GCM10011381_38230 [Klenkia taihuensis]SFD72768.1 hypothetical protein SAMN05661030_4091 [Klenkia taihuensis]